MEEKYFWNGDEYTWKQLLFAFHTYITNRNSSWRYEWKESYYREDVDIFFKNFRHNDNDRKKNFDYCKTTYVEVAPANIVWDSYNRIISSGYLKQEFLKYVPNEIDRKPRKINPRYKRWYRTNTYEFRNGPVPNIHKWKKGSWEKYDGIHSGVVPEIRAYYACKVDLKEVKEEYDINIRLRRTGSDLDPWNNEHYRNWKGKGWKRTRKEKQWMKYSWKEVYQPFEIEEEIDCWELFEEEFIS